MLTFLISTAKLCNVLSPPFNLHCIGLLTMAPEPGSGAHLDESPVVARPDHGTDSYGTDRPLPRRMILVDGSGPADERGRGLHHRGYERNQSRATSGPHGDLTKAAHAAVPVSVEELTRDAAWLA